VAPGLVTAVQGASEGNPFFVEELVREAGGLEASRLALPRSVQDLLARRLRGMPDRNLRILGTAAVIGIDFDLPTLGVAAGCADAELVDGLDAASKARAIVPTGTPGTYSFAHALVRETVYAGVTAVRRAHLHRLVGEALEASAPDEDGARAAALAHHFSAAGDLARAFRYHAVAAQAAARVEALRAGIDHCDAALAIARTLGPGAVPRENVAAVELESYLMTLPAISMAVVIGVPDERLMEVAAAFIELHPGRTLSEDEVVRHCLGRIASYKIPRYVRFVSEWPMSATKVQKFRLRQAFEPTGKIDVAALAHAAAGEG